MYQHCDGSRNPCKQTTSNRNALIEEFTGVNCSYCPDGHRIADEIVAANPGRFVAVNITQGSYASDPTDFRIQDGENLDNTFSISGYPTGVVSRAQGNTSSRGAWAGQVAPIHRIIIRKSRDAS